MKMKKSLIVSALLLSTFLVGCGEEEQKETEKEKPVEEFSVATIPLVPKTFEEKLTFYGKTKAYKEATLIAYEAGRVNSVKVKEGDYVSKGKSLCNIDAAMHVARVEAAQLAYEIAKDQVDAATAHLESGSGSQVALNQAKMQMQQNKQNLLNFQKVKAGALCIAPFSGRVGKVYVEDFQNIAGGTPTITLVNESKIKVKWGIPESKINSLKKGQAIDIINTVNAGEAKATNIRSIGSLVDPKERTFSAEAWVNNKSEWIRGGHTAKIKAVGNRIENAMVVPNEAILPRAKKSEVMVAMGGKAQARAVKILASNETESLIEGKLDFGELLIVQGQGKVITGSKIKATPVVAEVAK